MLKPTLTPRIHDAAKLPNHGLYKLLQPLRDTWRNEQLSASWIATDPRRDEDGIVAASEARAERLYAAIEEQAARLQMSAVDLELFLRDGEVPPAVLYEGRRGSHARTKAGSDSGGLLVEYLSYVVRGGL